MVDICGKEWEETIGQTRRYENWLKRERTKYYWTAGKENNESRLNYTKNRKGKKA